MTRYYISIFSDTQRHCRPNSNEQNDKLGCIYAKDYTKACIESVKVKTQHITCHGYYFPIFPNRYAFTLDTISTQYMLITLGWLFLHPSHKWKYGFSFSIPECYPHFRKRNIRNNSCRKIWLGCRTLDSQNSLHILPWQEIMTRQLLGIYFSKHLTVL